MDKKTVVHKHNGILLSHYKEYIWISSNEVDKTGAYYTEWSLCIDIIDKMDIINRLTFLCRTLLEFC